MHPVTPFTRHALASGPSIRLRLPQRGDLHAVVELCRRTGRDGPGFDELRAALRFDPRRRSVIVATTWNGSGEDLVGIAAIDLDLPSEPDLLIADPACGDDLPELLRRTLEAHADRAA
ncbi:MAG TPA: hypothetical protein VIL64_01605 [Solirubrobacteraceae bacterium]|jgi:hypothetical protein